MARPWYCTREMVKAALDVAETARNDFEVDRAIGSGADSIESLTHRRFYPWTGTRYFPWPPRQSSAPWVLWLDQHELISLTTLMAGGVEIPSTDYFLEPVNNGPPYTSIEIDLSSTSAFAAGATWQRAIAATGVFGHSADEETVGSLTANLAASTSASGSADWTTSRIGVGDILRIDDERVIVTAKSTVDSTQDLASALTASSSDDTVSITDGTAFAVGEVLLVDTERMLIVDKVSNDLTVKRAYDGTVLAAHSSGADVFTLTGVQLDRAQLGTTLAAHLNGATIYRHLPPNLVRDLNIAEAINQLQLETSAYARIIGEGENAREGTGRSLFDLRRDVVARFGRKARSRVI